MKYVILIMDTEAGLAVPGPEREAWMGEIMAWYDKVSTSGKLGDGGHQLDRAGKARTVRASGVTDGPFMEASRRPSSSGSGTRTGAPASRSALRARDSRWAMVGSPVRYAAAISAVVRPHTARRVSATCHSLGSDGWQHANTRPSRSSSSDWSGPATGSTRTAPPSPGCARPRVSVTARSASFSSPARARRSRSIALRRAVVASHPPGLGGTPSAGQCSRASVKASCTRSSASPTSPSRRASAARSRVPSVR
jgi:hypothetical protein